MNASTSHRSLAAALVLAVGALGASGCSSSSAGSSPFNGSWTCTTTSTTTFTEPKGEAAQMSTTKSTLVLDISSGDSVTVHSNESDAATSGDGGVGCSVTYETSGNTASLAPNQSCSITSVSGKVTSKFEATYTTGSGTANGTTLTFSQSDALTGTITSGAVSVAVAGTISGTTTCTQ